LLGKFRLNINLNTEKVMKNFTLLKLLSVIFIAILFSSCISIERTIRINEDGSGKEMITIHYKKEFFDFLKSTAFAFDSVKGKDIIDSIYNEETYTKDIKKNYKKINGITLKDVKTKMNPDSSMNLYVDYTFENIEKLSETLQSIEKKDENTLGNSKTEISFKKSGKKYLFNYNFQKIDRGDTNSSMNNSFAAFFKDQKMTYHITFPFNITSTNAMKTNGKTLTWEFDMDKMMTDTTKMIMEAEMKKK
ncbi:MAG: hypothetical protein NTU73_15485, partial [Ignavibacteriae bacterium]|nr:hypothetical protein [Ignavibacteriota bacterium]